MNNFVDALLSDEKHKSLPDELDFFGKLIGSWKIDYIDTDSRRVIKGEWYFSRTLEGMAVQDVIVLPGFEYGTTLRVFNPVTHAWDVAYCYAGKIIRLEARKHDSQIVLTDIDDKTRKWIFADIGDNHFHWQDVTVNENGKHHVKFDIYAERID